MQKNLFRTYLKEISDQIILYSKKSNEIDANEGFVKAYDETKEIRNDYLLLLRHGLYVDNCQEDITSFFEETADILYDQSNWRGDFSKIFIHEIFIYTIAYFWISKNYNALGYIFGKTYFSKSYMRNDTGATSYNLMYSGSHHNLFDKAVKTVDGKNYYSGTAAHWITNLAVDFCSKEQFVFADLLCFNYSIYGKNYLDNWRWFPVTYCYDSEYDSVVAQFAKRLISKAFLEAILPIFCFDSADAFIENMKSINMEGQKLREYRYSNAFESANTIGYFIQPDVIGTLP